MFVFHEGHRVNLGYHCDYPQCQSHRESSICIPISNDTVRLLYIMTSVLLAASMTSDLQRGGPSPGGGR